MKSRRPVNSAVMPLNDMTSQLSSPGNEPTELRIRRINVASLAKWVTFSFLVLGVFAGIIYTTSFALRQQISPIVMLWYFVLTPFLYAVVGLISSIIIGTIYNRVADKMGGIVVAANIGMENYSVPPPPPHEWDTHSSTSDSEE